MACSRSDLALPSTGRGQDPRITGSDADKALPCAAF